MTIRTPNTFIVGAGPVATALAGALRLGGVPVLGLWARKPAAARSAAAISGVASYSAAPPDLLLETDVVIVAVRDSAISEVAATLVATGLITTRHVMLHCSGVVSAEEAFAAVQDQLGGTGTLHPLRAIADGNRAMREIRGTVFGVEGDERGTAMALELVRSMGGTPLQLSGAQMGAYHAAAAIAANYLVALVDAAVTAVGQAGVSESDAVAALVPLMQSSLKNITEHGVTAGLTGPFRRGDEATVRRHLQALMHIAAGSGDDGDAGGVTLAELYRVLGKRTLRIARRQGEADAHALDAIDTLLSSPGEPKDSSESLEQSQSGSEGGSDVESRAYQA